MKMIRYTILTVLCLVGFTSCQDDLLGNSMGADKNKPVEVSLNFSIPKSMEVQVSRADNSKSDIETVRIYAFSGGSLLGEPQDLNVNDGGLIETGHSYMAKATLYVGQQTVYAIANAATRNYWTDPTNALNTAAVQGEEAFLETVYDLYPDFTSNRFLPTFPGESIPLTGKGEITVSINGGNVSVDGKVQLQRPAAKIIFDIEREYKTLGGHTVKFTPQYYGVYKVAAHDYVLASNPPKESNFEGRYFYNTPNDQPISLLEEGVYVPENIQTGEECKNYNDREAFDPKDGNSDETKIWTYAPENATYVVIRGTYSETDENGSLYRSADVSYTIHLGDWSEGDFGNFSVLRNYIYTYHMTVQGVDKIVVEAQKEPDEDSYQNGAEGDVIELGEGSEVFNLDAHYEQIHVKYDLSSIASQIRSEGVTEDSRIDELIANSFILSIHTPMNQASATDELLRPYKGDDEDGTTSMQGLDYKWIQFYSQTTDGLSTYTKTKGNDDYMLNAWQACRKMGQAVKQLVENSGTTPSISGLRLTKESGHYIAHFTIFVDEYFYTHDLADNPVDWSSFTRTDPRSFMIATNMEVSEDGNSSYAKARTYVSQNSIQTFYNRESADNTNALGIESYNEHGVITGFGSPKSTIQDEETNMINGRENMFTQIKGAGWNNYKIDFTKIGYRSSNVNNHTWNLSDEEKRDAAYIACLSRNRDLDRDGAIDKNEVHWYLPARSQYLRMGIGARSLGDYQLYMGDKMEMQNSGYPYDYVKDGALYYSNTTSGGYFWELYWAVEVGAFGSNEYGTKAQIRCVRNLPSRSYVEEHGDSYGEDALAGPVHGGGKRLSSSGNYIFDFENRMDASLYRVGVQEGPYGYHNEDGNANMLPGAFVVSKDYLSDDFSVSEGWSTSSSRNPCANYSEKKNWSDRGVWRVPNLNELTIMTTEAEKIKLDEVTLCSTHFTNTKVRIGFRYNKQIITAWNPGAESSTGKVRCVRDATAAEIEEVRGQ